MGVLEGLRIVHELIVGVKGVGLVRLLLVRLGPRLLIVRKELLLFGAHLVRVLKLFHPVAAEAIGPHLAKELVLVLVLRAVHKGLGPRRLLFLKAEGDISVDRCEGT